eukprot:jgi/Chlat1/3861/Chrsp26S04150
MDGLRRWRAVQFGAVDVVSDGADGVAEKASTLLACLQPQPCTLSSRMPTPQLPPSPQTDRVIIHVDVDAFYAQVEERRDPSLRERPLGIQQKYLVVTCNYPARARGVGKLMPIDEAFTRCPELVLVKGEDLTPYRAASKQILAVLRRFGPVERLGMDEVFIDATAEVHRRITEGSAHAEHVGHVHAIAKAETEFTTFAMTDCGMLLVVGSQVAADARAAINQEAGFRCSAGIAHNKMLAKLCSSIHKPNDQTIMPPLLAAKFMATLSARKVPGIGYRTNAALQELGVSNILELRTASVQQLDDRFGARIATMLRDACWGIDNMPVVDQPPPKSITVEDSFQCCSSVGHAEKIARMLAPDLIARLKEDHEDTGRLAGTFTVKWRFKGDGYRRTSASCPMPVELTRFNGDNEQLSAIVTTTALALFKQYVTPPFHLTLLNIGATNFTERPNTKSESIAKFFTKPLDKVTSAAQHKRLLSPSKSEARLLQERGKSGMALHLAPGIEEPSTAIEGCPAASTLLEGALESDDEIAAPFSLPEAVASAEVTTTSAVTVEPRLCDRDPAAEASIPLCPECGQLVRDRQEHADYHFALKLHNEERSGPPSTSTTTGLKRQKSFSQSQPRVRGPLDTFFQQNR